VTILGGDGFMALPEMMRIEGPRMGDEIHRAIETGVQGMRGPIGQLGGRQNW
jgi:hypothetical protein